MATLRFALLMATVVLSAAPDREAFSKDVLRIYQQADVEAFLLMVEVEEATPAEIRGRLRDNFVHNAKKHAVAVRVEPLSGDEITGYRKDGEDYGVTLKPAAKAVVSFDDPEVRPRLVTFMHLLGVKDGKFRIVTVRKIKKAGSGGPALP